MPGEDVFAFVQRRKGRFDAELCRQILGAANEFKEGDRILGVAAADEASRKAARRLLAATRVRELDAHPVLEDPLYDALRADLDPEARERLAPLRLGELRDFLLQRKEAEIQPLLDGLSSDAAACLVKLMPNEELIAVGSKLHHALPGSKLGARGYLGARIQPNSPTDNPEDIFWQVLCGFSYAVGDLVLGTNPVGSEPQSVALLENTLLDIRRTFGVEDVIPHCVLSHIDIQALVEERAPGTTGVWFQSLAGSTAANQVFDLTLDKLLGHARQRTGKYGFYFETGQGSEFTNGQGQGVDMVTFEARKYGLARLLKRKTADAQRQAGRTPAPWVHVNDVAGFIGPEVFRTREQLVRCCLEDIVMGKLHGLTIGLDICSTLHMDVSLDDLDWCMDRIIPGAPAYLMALPTKMDPMLGYLSTAFQDHVRMRGRFGLKINDAMREFYQRLGVLDARGEPTERFGRPLWVWRQYCKAKGDARPEEAIEAEGKERMRAVRARGVPLAEGYGKRPWNMRPELDREIRNVYQDGKVCIWAALTPDFVEQLPGRVLLATNSKDREDYILHPQTGESLDNASQQALEAFARRRNAGDSVQLVVSDGLNAKAITDPGNLRPYLDALREELGRLGFSVAPELLVVRNGRVRVGYRIGEKLFGGDPASQERRCLVHVIGERPGSMHHAFSAYLAAPPRAVWSETGRTDHNIARVISGLAATTTPAKEAAKATARVLGEMCGRG
jgi:ethanolamine ammonia-lyase large subunit